MCESLKCLVWSDRLKTQVCSLNNLAKQSCQVFMSNVTLLKQKVKKQHEEKGKIRKHEQELRFKATKTPLVHEAILVLPC